MVPCFIQFSYILQKSLLQGCFPMALETCQFFCFLKTVVLSPRIHYSKSEHMKVGYDFYFIFLIFSKLTLVTIPKASHGFEKNSRNLFFFFFFFLVLVLDSRPPFSKYWAHESWFLFCCKIFINDSHITSQSSRKMSNFFENYHLGSDMPNFKTLGT